MYLKPRDWGVLAIAVIIFHLVGTALVRYFYAYHIAHYDSVGGLLQAVDTLSVYRQSGYWAAVAYAWEIHPLSISQNLFPALFAPFLDPSPAGLQTYNSVAAGIAMLGVAVFLRRAGLPLAGIILGITCIWVGDALYWWDLGAFDYRRDFAMYALLTSSLCFGGTVFLYNHTTAAEAAVSILFGVVTGLTLISRDSAPLMLMGCIVVPMAALAAFSGFREKWLTQARKVAWSLVGFAPFAIVFIVKLPRIMDRLANPLTMYGGDPDQKDTFVSTAHRVTDTILGLFDYPFNKAQWITSALLLLIMVTFALLWFFHQRRVVESSRTDTTNSRRAIIFLLLTAVWIPAFLHVQLSLIMKFGAYHPPINGIAPYLPVLVGLSAALLAGLIYLRNEFVGRVGTAVTAVVVAAVAWSIPERAMTRLIQYPPGTMKTHEEMARIFDTASQTPSLAVLSQHTELFRIPAIQLISKMKGFTPPTTLQYYAEGYGWMDFQVAIPADPNQQQVVLAAMDHATRCDADFIVIDTAPSSYTNANTNLLLYAKGEAMVAGLLADLAQSPRTMLGAQGTSVVIDNQQRVGCVSASH